MRNLVGKLLRENRSLLLFILLMSVFRSAVADWNTVPTGSMKPTIVEGDRILVDKAAYDIRLPFTHISLVKLADPQRGDIIVFDSAAAGKKLVKRVVAVPGDVVAMDHNRVYLNGKALSYHALNGDNTTTDVQEDLAGIKHLIRIHNDGSTLSSFPAVTVPAGYYLALGDNRDNSADSRVIGFIPRQEIVGRSRSVVMSLNYDNYYLPRPERFWHTL
ncbi:signal peptidase I [Shewanella fodinae]|jgi:signal peptidase I|uniref:signal peptidase I n=1 Tax=Shewanella fodinae TaxID=552357 RepID=UPI001677781F|nr:signal peptidase I [Shewanella fodinae]MCL2905965.1 signal peptidase I [Shewanella fodinae]GGY95483.1 signal peptidase I [Shewanella fodinae]